MSFCEGSAVLYFSATQFMKMMSQTCMPKPAPISAAHASLTAHSNVSAARTTLSQAATETLVSVRLKAPFSPNSLQVAAGDSLIQTGPFCEIPGLSARVDSYGGVTRSQAEIVHNSEANRCEHRRTSQHPLHLAPQLTLWNKQSCAPFCSHHLQAQL